MTDPLHIRFLTSGTTWGGSVWRRGQPALIPADDADGQSYFGRTEAEQRAKWGETRWEHIDAATYAELLGTPSLPPEPATVKPAASIPPPEDGAERGLGQGRQAPTPAPSSHTPPAPDAATTVPPAPLTGSDRWPWYEADNADKTLARVADMPESEAVEFLAWEKANKNRKSVVGPMTGT